MTDLECSILGGLVFSAERNDHQRVVAALALLQPSAFEATWRRIAAALQVPETWFGVAEEVGADRER